MTGHLILIVGPSGVGKDTLIEMAKAQFDTDSRFSFPQRIITRFVEAGGEAHLSVTPSQFEKMRTSGDFSLWWEAHGLSYAIPREIEDTLRSGRHVIANVSRGAIPSARNKFANVSVINITAPSDVLRARLLDRGRENVRQIEERIARAKQYVLGGPRVFEFVNDRPLDLSAHCFVSFIGWLAVGPESSQSSIEHNGRRCRRRGSGSGGCCTTAV